MRRAFARLAILVAGLGLGRAIAAIEAAPLLQPVDPPFEVTSPLRSEDGEVARDISGIACPFASADGTRRCLVVNDEGRSAQYAILSANALSASGPPVRLVGDSPADVTYGAPPVIDTCKKKKPKFKELDGEAVAYAAPYFYVTGSHGCSRHKGKFDLAAFVLARVDPRSNVETTYRLADALREAAVVGEYFGQPIESDNGLNVEGIAVVGDRLYAGLRAPSLDAQAFLVAVSLQDLFRPGHEPLRATATVEVIRLRLGPALGIRDLSPLADGRLLVLAGPAQDQPDIASSLFIADPAMPGAVKAIGRLGPLPSRGSAGKAEAVLPLDRSRVLIMFDSLPSGGPTTYKLPSPLP